MIEDDNDIGRDLAAFLDEHRARATLDTGFIGEPRVTPAMAALADHASSLEEIVSLAA